MRIGFIGLGNMGSGMAANLLSAGHEVVVFNRSPDKAAALTERGATAVPTVAAACDAEVVVTMLADDDADVGGSLAEALRLSGAEVHLFDNGGDALARFDTVDPHVAILDIGMPQIGRAHV